MNWSCQAQQGTNSLTFVIIFFIAQVLQMVPTFPQFNFQINRKKSKVGTTRSQRHTMLAQDSFLGSLLVLPVELWNGIAG